MSKLGEWLGYTGDECPNCGRVRVESWSCGKHICEKCHWCIEDQAYYYEDWDDEEDSLYDAFYKEARGYNMGLDKAIAVADVTNGDRGTIAKVCISGSGRTFVETMNDILKIREESRKRFESELDPYRLRAESLGVDINVAYYHAAGMGISLDRYLDMVASLTDTFSKGAFVDVIDFPDEQPEWTDAQIRKQLKYEKNPMRIKELNKMLSGRKKKRK